MRRQRKDAWKSKTKTKLPVEPVMIAARRPDSPLLGGGGARKAAASAAPKGQANYGEVSTDSGIEDLEATPPNLEDTAPNGSRRRAVRIVRAPEKDEGKGNREQLLVDRLLRSQGRGAISRAADDIWECELVPPRDQKVQIQLLEHENENRARDAVFVMAELIQKESPVQRPVLDQRLRRLEQSAEDPITRDAAGALRRSIRVHHGA